MDEWTLNHLDRWLDGASYDEERDQLRARILSLVEEDPELLDRGWAALREMVESHDRALRYVVKCDDCKTTIRATSDIRESYAGGRCAECRG